MDPIVPADTDAPAPVVPVDAPVAAPVVPAAAPMVVAVPAPADAVAAAPAPVAVAGVAPVAEPLQAVPLNVGIADPMVAVLAWALTGAVGQWWPKASRAAVRKVLPAVAVLLACGLTAGVVAVQGEPLTVDVLLRGLGAAGAAVLAHSQLREALKPRAPKA